MDSDAHLYCTLVTILCFEDSFWFKDTIIDHYFQPVPLQEFLHNPACAQVELNSECKLQNYISKGSYYMLFCTSVTVSF